MQIICTSLQTDNHARTPSLGHTYRSTSTVLFLIWSRYPEMMVFGPNSASEKFGGQDTDLLVKWTLWDSLQGLSLNHLFTCWCHCKI